MSNQNKRKQKQLKSNAHENSGKNLNEKGNSSRCVYVIHTLYIMSGTIIIRQQCKGQKEAGNAM